MASKQVLFFATVSDLREVIIKVENEVDIKYYKTGLWDKTELKCYPSLMNEDIGIAKYGDNNLCTSYLAIFKSEEIKYRIVPQKNGIEKFVVDQSQNSSSIYFRPSGIYVERQAIIEGKLGTASNDELSIQLFKIFSRELRAKFLKIKGYVLGKDAIEYYKKGWRLTQNVNSPIEYDFTF